MYKVELTKVIKYDVIVDGYDEDDAAKNALEIPADKLPEPSYNHLGVSWIESNDGVSVL
jgi:hypothetical protein